MLRDQQLVVYEKLSNHYKYLKIVSNSFFSFKNFRKDISIRIGKFINSFGKFHLCPRPGITVLTAPLYGGSGSRYRTIGLVRLSSFTIFSGTWPSVKADCSKSRDRLPGP